MIGGISVSVTTGLGAAIVTTAEGNNQVRYLPPSVILSQYVADGNYTYQFTVPFIYFLLVFIVVTLGTSALAG